MKTRLTVAIDAELVLKPENYARSRGISLSALIERARREMSAGERPSFSACFRGNLRASEREDERHRLACREVSVIVLLDTDVLVDVTLDPARNETDRKA